MIIDEDRLRTSLDAMAERPAPPFAVDAPDAIVRGRRLVRRRRLTRAGAAIAASTAVAVLAVTLLPSHATGGRSTTTPAASSPDASTGASAPARPTGQGTDPLTLSGTFGWLPDNAQDVGYSLHDSPTQVQAVARGDSTDSPNTPMIWLTVYPLGTTPTLSTFADTATQLRVDAPAVNGHTAYWVTGSRTDPTNGGDTYLRWQSANGQWGELHGYDFGNDDVTATMLRAAAGVDFAPHAVALPLWISGLPSSAVPTEADLNRPGLVGGGAWEVYLALSVDGTTVEISVFPTIPDADSATEHGNPKPVCTHQDGLTGCIAVTGDAVGSAADLLKHLTLLGQDPAGWTTDVLVH